MRTQVGVPGSCGGARGRLTPARDSTPDCGAFVRGREGGATDTYCKASRTADGTSPSPFHRARHASAKHFRRGICTPVQYPPSDLAAPNAACEVKGW